MGFQHPDFTAAQKQWLKQRRRKVKIYLLILLILILGLIIPRLIASQPGTNTKVEIVTPPSDLKEPEVEFSIRLKSYLEAKNSPLADETDFLLSQKHWRLLVAISAIESQFCTRKRAYNCWGIGGDSAYRSYSSYKASIQDANDFIESWKARGKWQTVEAMNCSYVVPCSPNWVKVVNNTLKELDGL